MTTIARRTLDKKCSEAALQDAIVECAAWYGWLWFHDQDSRRNNAGFPDLVLLRDDELVFVELKTTMGKLRPEQEVWIEKLQMCPGVSAYVWRPEQWQSGEIEERLR